jgi:hypothetical protein
MGRVTLLEEDEENEQAIPPNGSGAFVSVFGPLSLAAGGHLTFA